MQGIGRAVQPRKARAGGQLGGTENTMLDAQAHVKNFRQTTTLPNILRRKNYDPISLN
jgi:hypothetical protein